MENHQQTSFTLEIDNFSEKEAAIRSPIFVSGGCKWFIQVYPKGCRIKNHLSVFLRVANPESLQPGWKRRAIISYTMLNQSGQELNRTSEACYLFCHEFSSWGKVRVLSITRLQQLGLLENNKLIIKFNIKVVEVVDEGDVTAKEMLDFKGFKVPYAQVPLVTWIFAEHPDIAEDIRPKNHLVKTAYMNVLLGLIEILNRLPRSLSEAELRNAHSELRELSEDAGFKLDWLKIKLEEISLERKNAIADGSLVEELEEHVRNLKLELDYEKATSSTACTKVLSLKKAVSDLKLELDNEKAKSSSACAKVLSLEKALSNEKAKSSSASAEVLSLKEAVSDLKFELEWRSSKSATSKLASLVDSLQEY